MARLRKVESLGLFELQVILFTVSSIITRMLLAPLLFHY